MLGIPTVLDRLITQAMLQVMSPIYDREFSAHSYGFRPGRSAHQAIEQACRYMADGNRWVVDLDLERFFDQVNHDVLMSRVARKIKDKRLLKLIRRYLTAGIKGGLVSRREAGTPQGSPMAPPTQWVTFSWIGAASRNRVSNDNALWAHQHIFHQ